MTAIFEIPYEAQLLTRDAVTATLNGCHWPMTLVILWQPMQSAC